MLSDSFVACANILSLERVHHLFLKQIALNQFIYHN